MICGTCSGKVCSCHLFLFFLKNEKNNKWIILHCIGVTFTIDKKLLNFAPSYIQKKV